MNMSRIPYGNLGVLCFEFQMENYTWPVLWRGWLMQSLWSWHHSAVNKYMIPAINLFSPTLTFCILLLARYWPNPISKCEPYPSFLWEQRRVTRVWSWNGTTPQGTYMTRHLMRYCGIVPFTIILHGDRKVWMLVVCSQLHTIHQAIN